LHCTCLYWLLEGGGIGLMVNLRLSCVYSGPD
jgi:hypothetical protein